MKFEYLHDYYFLVKVYDPRGQAYGLITHLQWKDMSLNHLSRWQWYFDYRAALLKVKYPRSKVEISTGQTKPCTKSVENFFKDKIAGKKRMITKISNAIEKYKEYKIRTDIFGIENDTELPKAEAKLEKYKIELAEVQKDFEEFLTKKEN